jgi:hypothetical protein
MLMPRPRADDLPFEEDTMTAPLSISRPKKALSLLSGDAAQSQAGGDVGGRHSTEQAGNKPKCQF